MKVTELSIGNLVQWGVHVKKIHCIHQDTHTGKNPYVYFEPIDGKSDNALAQYMDSIEPILLTEEWLLKFRFIKGNDDSEVAFYKKWLRLKPCFDESKGYEMIDFKERHIAIKYVHQLQNLYYALTGTELTFNQP